MPHTSAASSRLNWRPPADLNGLANAVCSQYPSHYLRTWCIQHYYRWCRTPRLPVVDWTDVTAYLNLLVRFTERWSLVSAHVPSRFRRTLLSNARPTNTCRCAFIVDGTLRDLHTINRTIYWVLSGQLHGYIFRLLSGHFQAIKIHKTVRWERAVVIFFILLVLSSCIVLLCCFIVLFPCVAF